MRYALKNDPKRPASDRICLLWLYVGLSLFTLGENINKIQKIAENIFKN